MTNCDLVYVVGKCRGFSKAKFQSVFSQYQIEDKQQTFLELSKTPSDCSARPMQYYFS